MSKTEVSPGFGWIFRDGFIIVGVYIRMFECVVVATKRQILVYEAGHIVVDDGLP